MDKKLSSSNCALFQKLVGTHYITYTHPLRLTEHSSCCPPTHGLVLSTVYHVHTKTRSEVNSLFKLLLSLPQASSVDTASPGPDQAVQVVALPPTSCLCQHYLIYIQRYTLSAIAHSKCRSPSQKPALLRQDHPDLTRLFQLLPSLPPAHSVSTISSTY